MSVPIWFAAMLGAGAPVEDGSVLAILPPAPAMPATIQRASAPPVESTPGQADLSLATDSAPAPLQAGAEPQDIVVTARSRSAPNDPIAAINGESFAATQAVDRALVGPLALAYKRTMPDFVRSGVRNFLYNLREPVVFLNFMLQHKPGKAAETVGRFVVNSTVGVGGVFDMARRRPVHLPRRPNGFADTMGFYGVKPGPFLFLPLIGPTTLRDFVGDTVDRFVLPLAVGKPFNKLTFTLPTSIVGVVDRRAEHDEELHRLHDGPTDPYLATRAFYLQRRQAEIDGLHRKHRAAPLPATPTTSGAAPTP